MAAWRCPVGGHEGIVKRVTGGYGMRMVERLN